MPQLPEGKPATPATWFQLLGLVTGVMVISYVIVTIFASFFGRTGGGQ
jgi:hypothetical protein